LADPRALGKPIADFDLPPGAPPANECCGTDGIEEVDRDRIVHPDAAIGPKAHDV
jgi:hypothetical protein